MAARLANPLARAVFQATGHPRHRFLRIFTCHLQGETAVGNATNDLDNENASATFAEIFRRSKFAAELNPVNQKVEGEVLAVVDEKMYVDFGCKFHAVVPLPKARAKSHGKGTRVMLRILDLEIINHFIGDHKDTSLLEAEAELVHDDKP